MNFVSFSRTVSCPSWSSGAGSMVMMAGRNCIKGTVIEHKCHYIYISLYIYVYIIVYPNTSIRIPYIWWVEFSFHMFIIFASTIHQSSCSSSTNSTRSTENYRPALLDMAVAENKRKISETEDGQIFWDMFGCIFGDRDITYVFGYHGDIWRFVL